MTATADSSVPVVTDGVTLTIDGIRTTVPKGTLIIRAAELLGIQIPRFCDHPLLDPVGACRQCLVEIPDAGNGRGMPKPAASCTTTVAEGMVVQTQLSSPVAAKTQAGNLELLLVNHPLDCPVCDKGGECPLQNQAMSNGYSESRFKDRKRTYAKPIAISDQVLLDRERCVLCARCTRFSQQVAGDPFIELFERGALEQVAIYADEPFESYFSGNTVQICPVGALTGASYRFRARPFDLMSTPSVCEHCASGCAQRTDWRRGKVMRRLAGEDPEVNEEWNCDKGRWAFRYATSADRITEPMVRDEDGYLRPASWTQALERAAAGLAQARDAGGVGVLTGGRLTVEDAYAYAKFARLALGTNDIDFRARPHSAEEADFLAAAVAGRYLETSYADLESAPAVLLAGFEPEEESPIVLLRLRKAARQNGTPVFGIGPFRTPSLTKTSGRLLACAPGEEPAVLRALAGPGVGHGDELAAAAGLLREDGAVVLVGERLAEVPGALTALLELAAATGARLAWVPRRAGDRGAVDAGCLPGLLPGGRPVADGGARGAVMSAWGGPVPTGPGRDGDAILAAARSGELAGLLIGGVDPADLADPQGALAALAEARFIVSLEVRRSAVTDRADVVLPVAPVMEKAGSFLNWEGRTRSFDPTLRGTGALTDGRVLHTLAGEMDVALGLPDTDTTRAEIARLGAWAGTRPSATAVPAAPVPVPVAGQAVLATWHRLLDCGSMQEGEEHLAGTARPPAVQLSPATAAEIGAGPGDDVTVATAHGSVTLPLVLADMPDRVVWVPANSPGSQVRPLLRAGHGSLVRISAGQAA